MELTLSTIEGPYQRDLLAQPEALRDTLKGLTEPGSYAGLEQLVARGRFTKAVLTGMGSSYHVLYPAFYEMNRQGIRTLMVETSELLYSMPEILDPETLLVVVSQSGESAEVVRLLERPNLPPVVAVTNTADSALARGAAATVLTRAGAEFSVSCKTYLAAVVAMQWLTDVVCRKNLERSRARLAEAVPAAAEYLAGWRDHVYALARRIDGVRDVFLAGRGASLATAGTGGLILKESTHIHAEGMSSPAFRHGPIETLSPSVFLMVFEGDRTVAPLNRRLVDDAAQAGGKVALVAAGGEPGPFRIPEVCAEVRPVLEMLPVQMLSLALGMVAGREPGRFEVGSKVTTVE